jgi:hypothetical protein
MACADRHNNVASFPIAAAHQQREDPSFSWPRRHATSTTGQRVFWNFDCRRVRPIIKQTQGVDSPAKQHAGLGTHQQLDQQEGAIIGRPQHPRPKTKFTNRQECLP